MSDARPADPRRRRADVAVADGADRRDRARAAGRGARGGRRARAAGAARRRRRPRPPQRPRARRLGGLRHRDRGAGGRRDDVRDRHAAQRGAADGRRRGVRRQGRGGDGRRARRRRAVGRPGARRPRPPRRARRPRRRGLQGLHVGQRRGGVRGRRRPDAAGGHGPRRAPGAARRGARRERGAHRAGWRAAPWPQGRVGVRDYLASRPVVAELEAIARAIAFAAETGLRAARRPRLERSRRGARGAGARARGRRDVRDVPALPRARRGGRRAPGRGGQVRAAAARRRRARGAVGGAARRRRRPRGHRPLARAGGAQGGRRLLRACGAGSRAPRRCWRCSTTRASWAAASRRRRWPSLLAAAPARRFGLAPAKGALEVGADADVALVDPAAHVDGGARGPARSPPAQPVRGPDAARPRGAHDPARAHDRARRADRRRRPAGAWCAAPPRLGRRDRPARRHRRAGAVQRRSRRGRDHARGLHADLRDRARVGRRAHARRGPRDAAGRRGQPLRPLGGQPTPDAPIVLTGSHVDTTLNAGRYDGVLGVLGAIEAVRALRAARRAPAALDRARGLGRRGAALRDRVRGQPRGRGRAAARGPRPTARP